MSSRALCALRLPWKPERSFREQVLHDLIAPARDRVSLGVEQLVLPPTVICGVGVVQCAVGASRLTPYSAMSQLRLANDSLLIGTSIARTSLRERRSIVA